MNTDNIDISLVMPCHNCTNTIEKAIESIIDQDIETWELICVVNGNWSTKYETIKKIEGYIKKDKRIKLLIIEEGNVCSARNEGASISTGKYLSFFSSDFYMFPGALRKWLSTFSNHSEVDFIYSGYRLMKDGQLVDGFVPSEPFDPWRLQIENYIDGGFPMKRHVWQRGHWDVAIKSLNDWDFWLTAIDNKFIGYYFLDMTYAAEIPKEGGLSYDSQNNWLERVSYIKKKHNIKEADICITSLGAQPHAKRIAKLIGADFKVYPMNKPNNYKAIYLLGFYTGNGESAIAHERIFISPQKEVFKGKQIVHWIGTDILQLIGAARKVNYMDYKLFIEALNRHINISECEVTKNELSTIGVQTESFALPIEETIVVIPLPKKFKVAVYTPSTPTAAQIYNLDLVRDIVKSCPDIEFLFFGGGLQEFKAKNLQNVGWKPMKEILENSSCLMRLTYHDGLPVTPIEFRLAGRDAITTFQMDYIHYAGTGIIHKGNYAERKEQIIKILRDVKKKQKKFGVKDVKKARKHYLALTSVETFKKNLEKIVDGPA